MATKRLIILVFLFVGLASFHKPYGFDDLLNSMKTGDAGRIEAYMDKSVDLSIPGVKGTYARTEAQKMMRIFFAKHPLKTFQLIHQTKLSENDLCIGTIVTDNGNFRATFLLANKEGDHKLREIRFE